MPERASNSIEVYYVKPKNRLVSSLSTASSDSDLVNYDIFDTSSILGLIECFSSNYRRIVDVCVIGPFSKPKQLYSQAGIVRDISHVRE